jgi:predicted RNase H-like nuclease
MNEPVIVAGVDGCPAGWIAVLWDGGDRLTSELCKDFAQVMALPAQVIAVDMPIGLPEKSGRPPEREVRAKIGARRSSVFPVPSRYAIQCLDYSDACRINRLHSHPPKAVPKQCFHLFPKMREVDALISPNDQSRIYESHPELAFWAMNDQRPLAFAKKAKVNSQHVGLELRKTLLRRNHVPVDSLREEYRRRDVGADDLIDACACTFVAWRILNRRSIRFPTNPPLNARGLRMEINA